MPRNNIHLDPGCPWYILSEIRLPNIKWCEANLCSWIVNPANTWSNVLYIILGFVLWRMSRATHAERKESFWLGLSLVVVGVTSFIHHAAYNFIFQILDFLGMYWFLLFVFFLNLVRLGKVAPSKMISYWALSVVGATLLTVGADFLDIRIQGIILVLSGVLVVQEMRIVRSQGAYRAPDLKYFWLATGFVAIASVCSSLDIKGVWCDPNNHWLQGHAAWHVLSACGLFLLSKHLLRVKPILTN